MDRQTDRQTVSVVLCGSPRSRPSCRRSPRSSTMLSSAATGPIATAGDDILRAKPGAPSSSSAASTSQVLTGTTCNEPAASLAGLGAAGAAAAAGHDVGVVLADRAPVLVRAPRGDAQDALAAPALPMRMHGHMHVHVHMHMSMYMRVHMRMHTGVRPTKVGASSRRSASSASRCSMRAAGVQACSRARGAGAGGRHRAGSRAELSASPATAAAAAEPPPPTAFDIRHPSSPIPALPTALAPRPLRVRAHEHAHAHEHVRVHTRMHIHVRTHVRAHMHRAVRGVGSFLRLSGVFFATRISAHYLCITYALPAHYSRIFCILSNAAECRLHPRARGSKVQGAGSGPPRLRGPRSTTP